MLSYNHKKLGALIMTDEGEDTFIKAECIDDLSDVPNEFDDSEEIGDFTGSGNKQSDAESSDDSDICVRRMRRTLPLLSDMKESDEDQDIWCSRPITEVKQRWARGLVVRYVAWNRSSSGVPSEMRGSRGLSSTTIPR
ncbi:hypothetical protein KM043_001326 [Ampulex compressa]|nr:hypothetical protein KM043_001326 [Ampulex compressa]